MVFCFGRRKAYPKRCQQVWDMFLGERSRSLTTGSGCPFFFHRARLRVMILPDGGSSEFAGILGYVAISSINFVAG